jgi:hypothetical protein
VKPGMTKGPGNRHKLCNVRTVPITPGRPLKVGDLLARNGAWDRKYKVLGISLGQCPWSNEEVWLIKVETLGQFFADGRVVFAPRKSVREIWTHKLENGEMCLFGYHRVVPAKGDS